MTGVRRKQPQLPSAKRRKVEAEKGLLDLPVNLMYEVFGPLDARSLLETANSHDTLRKHVMDWPDKRWEIVHLSTDEAIIDYETFDRKDAIVLLGNLGYFEENSVKICDLPYELLWQILQPLEDKHLLSVANCHPNLLRATKHLKNKRFYLVKFTRREASFAGRPRKILTQLQAEILLTGAFVEKLECLVPTKLAPDMRVHTLVFRGQWRDAYWCGGLIEKWRPKQVVFPTWKAEAFDTTADLARELKEVYILKLPSLTVEWLSYIPEWKFAKLEFTLDAKGKDPTPQFQAMFQKLYDQYVSGERTRICLQMYVAPAIIGTYEVGGLHDGGTHRVDGRGRMALKWGLDVFASVIRQADMAGYYMHTYRG